VLQALYKHCFRFFRLWRWQWRWISL